MRRLNLLNITLSDFSDNVNYTAKYRLVADGPPEAPRDLFVSHVTYDAALLSWTSGYDMGSRQYFFVMEGIGGGKFIQMSDRINDTSSSHGINATFTYQMQGLYSDTLYNISVVALNDKGSVMAPPVSFRTKGKFILNCRNMLLYHKTHTDGHENYYYILVGLVGAFLPLFVVAWILKRRRDRRSNESVRLLHKQLTSEG
ncbi:hypothetical protein DPMN_075727 [Dreissena polymorpha]|uniref:Fibronectin type-III domain-containing protein n=1 Tax=Dreissena polymorpha TaxID=45954 RepID=A0A9D3YKU7_DREPO|nr:hypothetical protein DPMN_075727 [Dreissena polymorpha]